MFSCSSPFHTLSTDHTCEGTPATRRGRTECRDCADFTTQVAYIGKSSMLRFVAVPHGGDSTISDLTQKVMEAIN